MSRRWSERLEGLGDGLLEALAQEGVARVPALDGVEDDGVLARWLYRRDVERRGGFMPWQSLSMDALPEATSVAQWLEHVHERSGMIYLRGDQRWSSQLTEALKPYGLWVLAQGDERVALPEDLGRLMALDALHDVATDPSLSAARRGLLAHCAAAGAVQLRGELGVGKALLGRWAHLSLDDEPLSWLAGDQGELHAGQWALFDEVMELSERGRLRLAQALRAQGVVRATRWARWPLSSSRKRRPEHPALAAVIGQSPALVEVLEKMVSVAPSTLPVLLCGEPGVGKEVLARALHELSGRAGEFVALDMGALAESLAESELFGHVKGAFSGAISGRQGAFKRAHGGTLFLDEIGNMSMSMQVKLLRALQEGTFMPVGADVPTRVDVRVVAATNADLELLTRQGGFRLDLLSRINAVTLRVPPLRERVEDIEALAEHFAHVHRADAPRVEPWCAPAVLEALREHAWPGNVRELGHVVGLALALAGGQRVEVEALGALSPARHRQVPVLTTHSGAAEELLHVGMERVLVQQMTAATLEVLPLRERGERALRHLILTGLRGRAITASALLLLASQPWWGNLVELYACLGALRQLPCGPITIARIKEVMPLLLSGASAAPIGVLLSAARIGDELEGLRRGFDSSALLIGRVPGVEALVLASQAGDERAQRWLRQLEHLLQGARPACLDLEFMRRLSRAHVVLLRGEQGLVVHRLEGTGLRVWATSWLDGQEREVEPLKSVELGPGGMLCWGAPASGRPYLRAFVYLGESALETFKHEVFAALIADEDIEATLLKTKTEQRVLHLGAASQPDAAHVWALEPHEQEALTDVLMSYRGGALKAHVSYGLAIYRGQPRYARLLQFFQEAPRLSQYMTRLYELDANAPLRERLAQRLRHSEQAQALLEAWPVGLRRVIEAMHQA